MAIQSSNVLSGVLLTTLSGRVTDGDLLGHYRSLLPTVDLNPYRELVDGRELTSFEVTPKGLRDLMSVVAHHPHLLVGGRVAMVAGSDMVFGMFRMWEIVREDLDYEVAVYRDIEEARRSLGI